MVQTNFKTANQLLREGKLDDAVAAYREAIALNPDFSHAHHNLGEALVKVGQIEEAIAAFGQAVAITFDLSVGDIFCKSVSSLFSCTALS
ncbi:tetratricopeptide repeat protein [Okeania sp. SIO2B9]|uniref:tetratricopeptide repeat protein n=1 Tax=Okeania sp. SIO2B9 TaxID=2607782 RepID=UPI00142B0EFA|nr:tetratricopeptide repeat protein [Okeania sp. SIO2B9]NES87982.1 tetratricopeptide repeat protein [Okeania sp. SIO2B9]